MARSLTACPAAGSAPFLMGVSIPVAEGMNQVVPTASQFGALREPVLLTQEKLDEVRAYVEQELFPLVRDFPALPVGCKRQIGGLAVEIADRIRAVQILTKDFLDVIDSGQISAAKGRG